MAAYRLHLDFNLDTAGEFELHQGVDGFGRRAIDVDETRVSGDFELFAALLVDEGGTVDCDDALTRGKGDGTADNSARSLHVFHNLLGRLFYQIVVIAFQLDTNLLTPCLNSFETPPASAG